MIRIVITFVMNMVVTKFYYMWHALYIDNYTMRLTSLVTQDRHLSCASESGTHLPGVQIASCLTSVGKLKLYFAAFAYYSVREILQQSSKVQPFTNFCSLYRIILQCIDMLVEIVNILFFLKKWHNWWTNLWSHNRSSFWKWISSAGRYKRVRTIFLKDLKTSSKKKESLRASIFLSKPCSCTRTM
jgi:hypothetical protein